MRFLLSYCVMLHKNIATNPLFLRKITRIKSLQESSFRQRK